jgi:putative PIN family toxin of toxin-antitoxin system
MRAVLDTSVFLSALGSRRGASFEILTLLRKGRWTMVLSNHLVHEYEEVGKRNASDLGLELSDIDDLLDGLCSMAEAHDLTHAWRPVLHDPDDEPLVQLAVESGAGVIVTHNIRHLRAARALGIVVLTPRAFLKQLREQP